jgi:hypothetical protein
MQRMFQKGKGSSRTLTSQPSMQLFMKKQTSGLPERKGNATSNVPKQTPKTLANTQDESSQL